MGRARERLDWLLCIEADPFTLNDHYFKSYRDKFLSFYRAARDHANTEHQELVKSLMAYKPYVSSPRYNSPSTLQTGMSKIFSGLNEIGLVAPVQAIDLAKLLPPDPMEPGLRIMAEARAYFQG
jgi:hypothetical protein